jgi:hypothetical protein
MAATKVRLDALERLSREVEELPLSRPEEVTTREAVRLVIPQVHAMQSKGYSLQAIAKFLSERGIQVTGVALKRYMKFATDDGKARRRAPTRRDGRGEGSIPIPAPGDAKTSGAKEASSPLEVARKTPSLTATVSLEKPTQPSTTDRRSAFAVRADTWEI